MSAQPGQWRVSTIEGVFETDLETLKQWIAEGCVQPTDRVSKGNLNWIEAGRAPMLRGAFSGEVEVQPTPVAIDSDFTPVASRDSGTESHQSAAAAEPKSAGRSGVAACHYHPDVPPQYVCRVCSATFCS